MLKKATNKHQNLITSLVKITIKKILEKHSKHKNRFHISIFVVFLLILLIFAIDKLVQRLVKCAFKSIEKNEYLAKFWRRGF